MVDWPITNKEWLFSGVGVAILTGVFALIKWLKLHRKPLPQALVRIGGGPATDTSVPQATTPTVRVDRIASVTAADIHAAIGNAPPLQRTAVAEGFVGLKIEWDTVLIDASEKDGVVRHLLGASVIETNEDYPKLDVRCNVKLADYRELGILPTNSKIRVYGEIESAGRWSVELRNVELKYLEARRGT